MIKLDTLQLAPVDDRNERFKKFYSTYSGQVRELSEYAAVEQDVLILSWAWTIGGFAGDEEQWIDHLVDVVSSEYDTHRLRERKRKIFDGTVLFDRLVEQAERSERSIDDIIAAAPWDVQQYLEWHYVSGYSTSEIANLTGVSKRTVERKFRQAYDHIRKQFRWTA